MRILGLDPGNAITGFGVIRAEKGQYILEEYGALRTNAGIPQHIRLKLLYEQAIELLERVAPEQVAIEELFFNRNTTTAVPVGQARGVLLLACAQKELPVAEYTPLQVKQALTGYGRAEKQQIQYMVARLLHLDGVPKPDDAADALAIAMTHANYAGSIQLRGVKK